MIRRGIPPFIRWLLPPFPMFEFMDIITISETMVVFSDGLFAGGPVDARRGECRKNVSFCIG